MKKTILTFGIISGVLSAVMMCATAPFLHSLGEGSAGYLVGYTTIVLSFLLVFFGIRSYRDNIGNGYITFGRGFAVGICITLISCAFYVVTWEIIYFNFLHHSMDAYFAQSLAKAQAAGATSAKIAQLQHMQTMYENPLYNAALTFIEPFPVGLIITLVSAGILRRRSAADTAQVAVPSAS